MASKGAGVSEDPVGTFLYFSDLLSRTVVDAAGKPIGKLWDLSIQLPEPYPSVRQLFIRPPGQADLLLVAEGSQVRSWTENPIPLTARVPDLRPSRRREVAEIRLRSPEFLALPKADPAEVEQRIQDLRNDWNDE